MNSILSALNYIASDDRQVWLEIGMAIKSDLGDEGFAIWDRWSQSANSYSEKTSRIVWKSIKYGGRITIATLYKRAIEGGWKDDGKMPSPAQEEARKQRVEREAQVAEAETKRRHAAAAHYAESMLKTAVADSHQYLVEKGFAAEKLPVLPDGRLFIPMRDMLNNRIIGAQFIRLVDNAWDKKFLTGQRSSGAVYRLGRAPDAILCEGVATGLTILAAVRQMQVNLAVVVCFSAGNIVKVARNLPGRNCCLADNDKSTTGERAAIATGLPWGMPDQVGEDCNDLHQRAGLMPVCLLVQKVIARIAA